MKDPSDQLRRHWINAIKKTSRSLAGSPILQRPNPAEDGIFDSPSLSLAEPHVSGLPPFLKDGDLRLALRRFPPRRVGEGQDFLFQIKKRGSLKATSPFIRLNNTARRYETIRTGHPLSFRILVSGPGPFQSVLLSFFCPGVSRNQVHFLQYQSLFLVQP